MVDDPISVVELQAIAHRQTIRNVLALVAASLSAIALAIVAVLAITLSSSVHHIEQFSDRSDCKTEYNSILNDPVKARDDLAADLTAQLGAALLAAQQGAKPTQADVDHYRQTQTELAAAIDTVKHEPSLDKASAKGFTLAGVHHPPCPVVG